MFVLSRKRRHGPLSIGYRRYISWLQFFPSTISAKFSHFLSVRYLRAISVTNLVGCSEACDCCQYFSPENTNDLLHQPDYRRRKRGDRSSRLINALILVCCIKNMMKNSAALFATIGRKCCEQHVKRQPVLDETADDPIRKPIIYRCRW